MHNVKLIENFEMGYLADILSIVIFLPKRISAKQSRNTVLYPLLEFYSCSFPK